MKKSLFAVLSILPLMLCSCGNTTQGVMGKSFTFSSCTSETFTAGTSEQFYTANNHAGSTKDAVVNKVVKAIYTGQSTTTSDFSGFSDLTFTTTPGASNINYNGKSITCYNYNYASLGEYSSTCAGYYMDLGNDWTSLRFLKINLSTGSYEDMTYDLGYNSGNTGSSTYSYATTAKDTSIKYDAANKALNITIDVTFVSTENETTVTSTVTYGLNFSEK